MLLVGSETYRRFVPHGVDPRPVPGEVDCVTPDPGSAIHDRPLIGVRMLPFSVLGSLSLVVGVGVGLFEVGGLSDSDDTSARDDVGVFTTSVVAR